MQIDLSRDLRIDLVMVLLKLSATDRTELERRCVRVFEAPFTDDTKGMARMQLGRDGIPTACQIQISPVIGSLKLEWRLAIIAHEVGHVLTHQRWMTEEQSEFFADNFAKALGFGFPDRSRQRSPPDLMITFTSSGGERARPAGPLG